MNQCKKTPFEVSRERQRYKQETETRKDIASEVIIDSIKWIPFWKMELNQVTMTSRVNNNDL